MSDSREPDAALEDDYDEEADSDFQADTYGAESSTSSSDDEQQTGDNKSHRPRKRRKVEDVPDSIVAELDSGDEATITEHRRLQRRQNKKQKKKKKGGEEEGDGAPTELDDESDAWRARTRAMRIRGKEEHKRIKLASSKGCTIDVDKVWEEMNRPAPLPPPRMEDEAPTQKHPSDGPGSLEENPPLVGDGNKKNVPTKDTEDLITIKRTYKFAGEVHVEEKIVPRSSAEAQLWLSQQQLLNAGTPGPDEKVTNRPQRKISRFDPNFSNLAAFKASWTASNAYGPSFKGPKLNVVEKSKMDWAAHVDTEGLKEELDTHAKAKEGYLNRMDFLKDVEERREAEARAARLKGH